MPARVARVGGRRQHGGDLAHRRPPFWFDGKASRRTGDPFGFNGRPFPLNGRTFLLNERPFWSSRYAVLAHGRAFLLNKKAFSSSKKGFPFNKKGLPFNGKVSAERESLPEGPWQRHGTPRTLRGAEIGVHRCLGGLLRGVVEQHPVAREGEPERLRLGAEQARLRRADRRFHAELELQDSIVPQGRRDLRDIGHEQDAHASSLG